MIDIRPLTDRDDLKAVVRLQRQIWGFEDVDLIPLGCLWLPRKSVDKYTALSTAPS